jgi:tRNA(Ile)-lysidine synthase
MAESRRLHYHRPVRSQVLSYIRDRGLMAAGDRVCVAVSGGADSVALLRVLLQLQTELGIVLGVAHFNHGLRGEDSEADQAFVADLARQHGLELFAGGGDVRAYAASGKLSIEAAGRKLRYRWFARLADEQRFDSVATAHTLDDQAETVLLKFLRGAGTRGLAGIYPSLEVRSGDRIRIVRPMLCVTRTEVEAYLTSLGQPWREDESNLDHRFVRNRVRHELLPLLERDYNPNIRRVLSAAAELSRAEEEYWQALVERELEMRQYLEACDPTAAAPPGLKPSSLAAHAGTAEAVILQRPAPARLSLKNFAGLPLALQRRLLRRFAETQDLTLDFEHVEKLVHCAAGETARTELPGGWLASSRGECLELRAPAPQRAPNAYEHRLAIPGEVHLAELGITVRALVIRQEFAVESAEPDNLLSADLLGAQLTVRNWRPGDRFWPVHTGSSEQKLKRLFADKHIPAEQRPSWPVALSAEEIVGVRGFPVARDFAWKGKGAAVQIQWGVPGS